MEDSEQWIFLVDRDGVINVDVGHPGVLSSKQFEFIPGTSAAVAAIYEAGHLCRVVTNQAAISRGLTIRSSVDRIHENMVRSLEYNSGGKSRLAFGDIFVAEGIEGQGFQLKPSPDLLLAAAHGFPVERAIMIGDNLTDLRAAEAAGVSCAVLVSSSAHGLFAEKAIADGTETFELPLAIAPDLGSAVSGLLQTTIKDVQ